MMQWNIGRPDFNRWFQHHQMFFAGLTAGLCGENDNDTLKIKNTSSILVSLINLFKVYFISVVNYMESVECCVLSFFNEEDNVLLQYFCLCVLL